MNMNKALIIVVTSMLMFTMVSLWGSAEPRWATPQESDGRPAYNPEAPNRANVVYYYKFLTESANNADTDKDAAAQYLAKAAHLFDLYKDIMADDTIKSLHSFLLYEMDRATKQATTVQYPANKFIIRGCLEVSDAVYKKNISISNLR
jgi:hypothetical protein